MIARVVRHGNDTVSRFCQETTFQQSFHTPKQACADDRLEVLSVLEHSARAEQLDLTNDRDERAELRVSQRRDLRISMCVCYPLEPNHLVLRSVLVAGRGGGHQSLPAVDDAAQIRTAVTPGRSRCAQARRVARSVRSTRRCWACACRTGRRSYRHRRRTRCTACPSWTRLLA